MRNVVTGWSKGLFQVTFAVIAGVLFSVVAVQAATTISTNMQTDGTLSVTGLSTLGNASSTIFSANSAYFGGTATATISVAGAASFPSTLSVTGLSTLGNASSTIFSANSAYFGGTATATISVAGAASFPSTLSVTGLATFLGGATTTNLTLLNGGVISNATNGVIQMNGIASSTSITLLNGDTITNAVRGTIAMTATNVTFSGTASTTSLKVGSDTVSTISGIIFGYCNLTSVTVNATSTAYTNCAGATGVTSSYSVFVQATSSMPAGLIVDSASSTATTGTINVRITNATAGANTATGPISLNFWAVR